MKKRISFIALFIITSLLNYGQPTATFRGLEPKYGDGRDGSPFLTTGGTLYTDQIRAVVTDIDYINFHSTSDWQYEYKVYHNSNHGNWSSGLSAGDVVLLYQGYHGEYEDDNDFYDLCGDYGDQFNSQPAHFFAYVQSVNTGNVVVRSDVWVGSTLINHSAFRSVDRVQIIRVPMYRNLNLPDNFTITCSAWDGYTGGIIAFLVEENLRFQGDNIIIDANAKGYRNGAANTNVSSNATNLTSLTNGYAGSDADNYLVPYTQVNIRHISSLAPNCDLLEGTLGGLGQAQVKADATTHYYKTESEIGCVSTDPFKISMGSGGKGGKPGEYGASAGGHGGAGGGAVFDGTKGTYGSYNSGSSGAGGKGGVGGGLIYIWAYEYDYSSSVTSNKIFQVKGGDADNGADGVGMGGNGGNGGKGAPGKCNGPGNYIMPGGAGKAGQGGNGADAGSGGDGGFPGYIRFFFSSATNQTMVPANVCNVKAGKRGIGGTGTGYGSTGSNSASGDHDFGGVCNACYATITQVNEECNCAKAFALIANEATNYNATDAYFYNNSYTWPSNVEYATDPSQKFFRAEYVSKGGDGFLKVIEKKVIIAGQNSPTVIDQEVEVNIIRCVLKDGSNSVNPIPLLATQIASINTWTGDDTPNNQSVFGDYEFNNDANGVLGDFENPNTGYIATAVGCDNINGDGTGSTGSGGDPVNGKDGDGGLGRDRDEEVTEPGTKEGEEYPYDFTGNYVFSTQGPVPPPMNTSEVEKETVKIFPNPVKEHVSIIANDQKISSIVLMNATGQVIDELFVANESEINIDLTSYKLNKGIYLLQVNLENSSLIKNMVVE